MYLSEHDIGLSNDRIVAISISLTMTINITYRLSRPASGPKRTSVKNSPLNMNEIDANMRAVEQAFEASDATAAKLQQQINEKAPINKPTFTGYLQFPTVKNNSYPTSPSEGMFVYNLNQHTLVGYQDGKWQPMSNDTTMGNYVSRAGDIMTGKLTGTTAEFFQNIKALPPEATVGKADPDTVATVDWVLASCKTIVDQRLGGSNTGIVINTGGLTIKTGNISVTKGNLTVGGTIYGNIDMGIL